MVVRGQLQAPLDELFGALAVATRGCHHVRQLPQDCLESANLVVALVRLDASLQALVERSDLSLDLLSHLLGHIGLVQLSFPVFDLFSALLQVLGQRNNLAAAHLTTTYFLAVGVVREFFMGDIFGQHERPRPDDRSSYQL